MLRANIDADYVIHNVCAAAEYGKDPDEVNLEEVFHSIEAKCCTIMEEAKCATKRLYLTKGNFRHFVIGDYKANRKNSWRPECLQDARNYAELFMGAVYEQGLEADDLLAIEQTDDTVLCTVDKDLDMVDGKHLRIKTQHQDWVHYNVEEGWRKFYHQLLIGDTTDNIIGCGKRVNLIYKSGAKIGQPYTRRKGVGEKQAISILDGLTEQQCLDTCIQYYKDEFGSTWEHSIEQQGRLVWMVNRFENNHAKMWTVDGREAWMNPVSGVFRLEG